jgi:hypothetical protein
LILLNYYQFKNYKDMKNLLFILAFAASSVSVNAQDANPLKFSIGLEAALPVGDFADASSFGIGGSAQADYWVADKLTLLLNAGYISFQGKSYGGVRDKASGFIPVQAGFKYKLAEQLYGLAQLGATFVTEDNSETLFTYAPGLGYQISPNFDILLKYTGFSAKGIDLSAVGLRLAYTF